jgi:Ca2+-binding EF-hand superfamily protein
VPPDGSVGEGGVILDASGRPLMGDDGQPLRVDARVPCGGSVGKGGVVLDASGNPVLGSDGQPLRVDRWWVEIPPGGSIGEGGVVLDDSGTPVLGSDGRPLYTTGIGPGGVILDASGEPVLGKDGKPRMATAVSGGEDRGGGGGRCSDVEEGGGEGEEEEEEAPKLLVDWAALTAALPVGKDEESTGRRKKLFEKFDGNSNGTLSVSEIDASMRSIIKQTFGGLLQKSAQLSWQASWKKVIMRAFQTSRDANRFQKAGEEKRKDDYVERDEFRMLLVCMRQYFELYVAFCRLDLSDDKRIDLEEFKTNLDMLHKWGVPIQDEEAEEVFNEIDANKGGFILFDEFCLWAITRNLDLEDDDDFEDEELKELVSLNMERRDAAAQKAQPIEVLIPSMEYLKQQEEMKEALALTEERGQRGKGQDGDQAEEAGGDKVLLAKERRGTKRMLGSMIASVDAAELADGGGRE